MLDNHQKIRIKLQAYDHRILDQSAAEITRTAERTGATVIGPIPIPTHFRKFSPVRAPSRNKTSFEQFEMRSHKRLLDIKEFTPQTVEALMKLDLASGVNVEIKL